MADKARDPGRIRNKPDEAEVPKPAHGPAGPPPPTTRRCGTMEVHRRLLNTSPEYVRARAASENAFHQARLSGRAQARAGVTKIDVVVHVVYNTAQQNIGDAQIKSQIDVLNRDYRKKNTDLGSVPGAFQPLAADARIEFALATTDPKGNATNGITRTPTAKASFADDDSIKSAATGGTDPWPADKYLNVWIAPRITSAQGDLLGYAQFPGGPAATDGVVILQSAFGTSGTAAAPFNLGRTATHEIGHWLNLRHIWGDDGSGCNGSDFVNDTPNQAGPNFGTPAFPHVTCSNGPSGDMFMNYMDYVDDAAMFMFTTGQVDRMQTCLDHDRSTIGTTQPMLTTPAVDIHATAAWFDQQPSLKFRDDIQTWPQIDAPGTLKLRDDGQTSPHIDSPMTFKFIDDVKQPGFEKPPFADTGKSAMSDLGFPPQQPSLPFFGGRQRGAPFVLATPHHATVWTQSHPQVAQATARALEQQLQQYEQVLQSYAQADAMGQLAPETRQQVELLHAEYQSILQEYRQLVGA